MTILYILIAICAGMTSALQSGSNQQLQKSLDTPLWAVVVVAGITLAGSLLVAGVSGQKWPTVPAVASAPWWSWIGGLLGLGFVLGTVYASPKLGAGLFMAAIVTAELTTGLLLDHFGLLGFEIHRAHIGRIIGATLMIGGLVLIAIF